MSVDGCAGVDRASVAAEPAPAIDGSALRHALASASLVVLLAVSAARADDRVERGRYLVETVAACGNCHTPRGPDGPEAGKALAGGLVFDEEGFHAVASNITPDGATGVASWSDADLARAIREGVRPDGTVIGPPMPIELYRGIADADLDAMVAYLRPCPP